MKLTSKSGIAIEVEISGFQESPIIVMKPQILKGMTIGGAGSIAASQKRTGKTPMPADSLYFKPAYFQMDLAPVYAAIAALPKKTYMARRVQETRNLDGDICTIAVWKIEGNKTTKNSYYLSDDQLGNFLDRKGITEIETAKAVEMWSAEYETPEKLAARKTANEHGNKITQHFADMEEMENGHVLAEVRDPTPEYPREG